MNTPVESLSSWQIALSPDEEHIILRPWVGKVGQAEVPAQHFALTLPVARMLHRQLAESIHLLEQRSAQTSDQTERRKAQQPVAKDRRKARHFEGSPSAHAGATPGETEPPKAGE